MEAIRVEQNRIVGSFFITERLSESIVDEEVKRQIKVCIDKELPENAIVYYWVVEMDPKDTLSFRAMVCWDYIGKRHA